MRYYFTMPRKLSKKGFTSGFSSKSFLGSAYPSVRMMAPTMDRRMGTSVSSQFAKLDKQNKSKGFFYKKA